jgi:Fe-S-cluster containining protein
VDFTYPINLRFHCSRCGLCCGDTKQKTRHILLLETEAKHITSKTSQPTADFSEKSNDKLPFIYEMKKTGSGRCVFLKENQCTIYSIRPLICMFYPFELKFDKNNELYIFDFTLECPEIGQGKEFSKKNFERLFELAKKRFPKAAGEHQPVPK